MDASVSDGGPGGSNGGYMQGGRGGSGGGAAARDAGAGPDAGTGGSTAPDAATAMDAGTRLDAGTDAATPIDASTPMDAAAAACGGELVFGLCWYLASEDTSCSAECADKGGFDSRAAAYVGTPSQGGSQAECRQIFAALGQSGSVVAATQVVGLGCHMWNDGTLYWLQSPAFTANAATASGTRARIVCACQR